MSFVAVPYVSTMCLLISSFHFALADFILSRLVFCILSYPKQWSYSSKKQRSSITASNITVFNVPTSHCSSPTSARNCIMSTPKMRTKFHDNHKKNIEQCNMLLTKTNMFAQMKPKQCCINIGYHVPSTSSILSHIFV